MTAKSTGPGISWGRRFRAEALRQQVRDSFVAYAGFLHLDVIGVMDSPVLGKKGNKEVLVGLKKSGTEM